MPEPLENSLRTKAFSQQGNDEAAHAGGSDDVISELRDTIGELQTIAQRRLNQFGTQVHDTIDARPWTSVAVAGLAGLALAVAIVPRSSREDRRVKSVAGFDLPRAYQFSMPQMPSIPSSYVEPITGRLERVVDSISKIDPAAFNTPAFDRVRNWVASVLKRDSSGN